MTFPWMQFYTRDWLDDPELNRCSIGAKGLLIGLMAMAHEGVPYGSLSGLSGPYSHQYCTTRLFLTPKIWELHLAELLSSGRIEESPNGVIFIPRMVKDAALRAKRASGGSKGGNPRLVNHKDNLKVNHKDNLKVNQLSAQEGYLRSDSDSVSVLNNNSSTFRREAALPSRPRIYTTPPKGFDLVGPIGPGDFADFADD